LEDIICIPSKADIASTRSCSVNIIELFELFPHFLIKFMAVPLRNDGWPAKTTHGSWYLCSELSALNA